MKHTQITPKNIRIFVIDFYTRILKDDIVGPFFIDILGDDIENKKWQEHIDILCEFWSAMILKEGDYFGSPFAPHATMKGLQRETFTRWLEILDECVSEMYDENCANQYKDIGQIISENFMARLGL